MKSWCVLVLAAVAILAAASAAKAEYEVIAQTNVEYAQHDGAKLVGDLYQPKGLTRAPAIIAVHGGGWQNGSRAGYRYWGPFLARNGYVVLSIDYRLGKAGTFRAPSTTSRRRSSSCAPKPPISASIRTASA
jgi:acetyl esterase/lipase